MMETTVEQEKQPPSDSSKAEQPENQKAALPERKWCRLHISQGCWFSQYFKDILRHYPAVFRLLEIEMWKKGNAHPHTMRGTPCIIDLYHEADHWNGSQCFQWLRRAIVLTADFLPTQMPSQHQLMQLYSNVNQIPFSESSSASSSSYSSIVTPSPEIDQNQEETPSDSSSNESKEEWK